MMAQAQPQVKIHGDGKRGISTGKNFKQGRLKKIGESKKWDMTDDPWDIEDDDDDEYVKETPWKKREERQLKSGVVLS